MLWLALGIAHITRMDVCMLPTPGSFATADLGYATYVAMARQDHRYNNPVTIVFTDLLSQILFAHRKREACRKARRNLRLLVQLVKKRGSVEDALDEMMHLGHSAATAICHLEDQLGTVTKQMVADAASVTTATATALTHVHTEDVKKASNVLTRTLTRTLTHSTHAMSGALKAVGQLETKATELAETSALGLAHGIDRSCQLATQASSSPSFGMDGAIAEASYAQQVDKRIRVFQARRRLRVKLRLMLFLRANPAMILFRRRENSSAFEASTQASNPQSKDQRTFGDSPDAQAQARIMVQERVARNRRAVSVGKEDAADLEMANGASDTPAEEDDSSLRVSATPATDRLSPAAVRVAVEDPVVTSEGDVGGVRVAMEDDKEPPPPMLGFQPASISMQILSELKKDEGEM